MKIRIIFLLVLVAGVLSLTEWISPSYADYYKGKTISLFVGGTAGGGMDLSCRAIAPFLEKNIPGNPVVIVKNMGGAGGTQARNYIYEKATKDGTALFWGAWAPIAQAIGEPGFRAKFVEMGFVGGISETYLNLISTLQHPTIKKPADIFKGEPLRAGGLRATSGSDLLCRLSLDVMGVKHNYIPGYRGGAKLMAAMMQKELDYMSMSLGMYLSSIMPKLVEKGEVMPIWYHPRNAPGGGLLPNKASEFSMTFADVYKQVHGKMPSGLKWEALVWVANVTTTMLRGAWGPPGMNEEALAEIRKGFVNTINDQEYLALSTKQFGTLEFVGVEAGNRTVDLLRNADPDILAFIKEYIASVVK